MYVRAWFYNFDVFFMLHLHVYYMVVQNQIVTRNDTVYQYIYDKQTFT